MPTPTLQDTLAELNELAQYFVTAEAAIKKGATVDMSAVDVRIAAVCLAVQNAIPEQQKLYLPELNTLLGLLDSCERAIRMIHPADTSAAMSKDQGHAGG